MKADGDRRGAHFRAVELSADSRKGDKLISTLVCRHHVTLNITYMLEMINNLLYNEVNIYSQQ